ncbi:major facilitator superfamily MFS_1 [Sulfolobus islandicus Y.G.57.14]|uniref:Major facilitator superfamily MFS_1 n=4 Tax=Saccharolobus islandicus TaxID=43080 RepID=C3ML65_SACI2|nr:MFS transporter [Sulfolobus islandicus]ACP36467.1 major facilitator superfamily MFS_1 [Sulfolobus islandicus L.S.2.15]ACP46719.1 major facilitator superfamily MFS_1 [Sulfolobus islandicus Y.G.57.14]ACP47592.1 major facilitator superfamily MFS_1 [Sulfolobus islandicus Y.N.15.51]ADB88251.1 major facilitator superfamily MFS_1 [Sulfolobus islandicus L.D.8.5]PVU77704.1 MFS transporter [Sulfolobus islandicus]
MKYLKIFAILSNLANNLVNPFISFVSAYFGMNSEELALITSATNAVPNISQYFLNFIKSKAKLLIFIGTLVNGLLWVISAFIPFNLTFLIVYFIITISIGIANFGWNLIMDKISKNSRGSTLSLYLVYGTIGALAATLITGLITGSNTELIREFFLISGLMLVGSAYLSRKIETDTTLEERGVKSTSLLKRFLATVFLFNLVLSLAWPIFPLAQVYKFHMNDENIAILSVETGVTTILFQRIVAKLTDTKRRLTLFLGSALFTIYPLSYALSNSIYIIYITNLASGFTNAVGSVTYIAYIFDNSDDFTIRKNLAVYNLTVGCGVMTGSILGGVAYSYVSQFYNPMYSINLMLIISSILRFSVSPLFLTIKDTRSKLK